MTDACVLNLDSGGMNSPLLREWLVTNGLGGYAAGTISGVTTRRYHSLLTAALPKPFGRQVMLNDVTLVASVEDWETILVLKPHQARAADLERRERLVANAAPEARVDPARQLVLAADQFITIPPGRFEDNVCAHAAGEEARTILRTFGRYLRDGLIPNLFPEGSDAGQYNTADATLWYFHTLDRYLDATHDRLTLRILLPKLFEIVDYHLRGTAFGIAVDPEDGLLRQGEAGYALTWMDAKTGDHVVTPRRGKAVEINALWYNALCLLEKWAREELADESKALLLAGYAERARDSFNQRFWNAKDGYLYDVVDAERGDDPACRPNHPKERKGARRFLERLVGSALQEASVGSISEIFDAEAPFSPRGCVAQAWSVAEVLRSWVITS